MTFCSMILPAFQKLRRQNCGHDLRQSVSLPMCYAAESNEKDEHIVLQNMRTSGYVVLLDRSSL